MHGGVLKWGKTVNVDYYYMLARERREKAGVSSWLVTYQAIELCSYICPLIIARHQCDFHPLGIV